MSLGVPNFLGFCACLRGLTESAADAAHSLLAVPRTLAAHYSLISQSLAGVSKVATGSEELENALIHFQFARRGKAGENVSGSHKARHAAAYIAAIDSDRRPVRPMYAELCEVVHPASPSLNWLTRNHGQYWLASIGTDASSIRDLCSRHAAAIEWVQQQNVNISILMLQVLNEFACSDLHTQTVRDISMRGMPAWQKLRDAFASQGIVWGD